MCHTLVSEMDDWKPKHEAINELDYIFTSKEHVMEVLNYSSAFLKFLSRLIGSPVPKVSFISLTILNKILPAPDLNHRANIKLIIPTLVQKLGDNTLPTR